MPNFVNALLILFYNAGITMTVSTNYCNVMKKFFVIVYTVIWIDSIFLLLLPDKSLQLQQITVCNMLSKQLYMQLFAFSKKTHILKVMSWYFLF